MAPLRQSFFAREVELVARELLGCRLRRGPVLLRITEVEAYAGPEDSASHARCGPTERNAPMWGPGGRAYVYLCYGIHNMLNVSADLEGRAAAVLIRGCEVLAGRELVEARRGGALGRRELDGPGKVGAALELDTGWSGHALYRVGGLNICPGQAPTSVLAGPRVGIDFASAADRKRPWRFAAGESRAISRPQELRPG